MFEVALIFLVKDELIEEDLAKKWVDGTHCFNWKAQTYVEKWRFYCFILLWGTPLFKYSDIWGQVEFFCVIDTGGRDVILGLFVGSGLFLVVIDIKKISLTPG